MLHAARTRLGLVSKTLSCVSVGSSMSCSEFNSITRIVSFAPVPIQKPYTPSLALALFSTYADPDTTASSEPAIGPEGFEKLCSDAQVPLDGALPLVMAWMLDAKEMGKIGKDEWVKGTGALQ